MTHKGIEMLLVLICHLLAGRFYLRVGRRLRICLVLFYKHLLIIELILKSGKLFRRQICHAISPFLMVKTVLAKKGEIFRAKEKPSDERRVKDQISTDIIFSSLSAMSIISSIEVVLAFLIVISRVMV